ncbi:MAG: TerB family tellurite resistance protein [Saprospiraceae bacterium]
MEIRGKLLVGLLGMVVLDWAGMPLGALWGFMLGSLLGHFFYDRRRDFDASEQEFREYQRRQGAFIYHVFALCAKMAKCDGPVNNNEVAFMERLIRQHFRLTDRARQDVIRVWKAAKDSDVPFENYARMFYSEFAQERHQVLNMMDLLFSTAASDGGLHPKEQELLLRAAGLFHISRLQFDRIKSRHYQTPPTHEPPPRWSPLDPHYAILGAQPSDPLDIIKQKFRKLAMQWHPDKLQARGASAEAVRHAKEKFQQINEAYERIIEARK